MASDNNAVHPEGTMLQNTSIQPASSLALADNNLTEFHLFNEFPPEIRSGVWDQARLSAPAPSKVYRFSVAIVTIGDCQVACFTPFKEVADLTREQRNLLRINKQSRSDMLRSGYIDMFLPFNYIDSVANEVNWGIFPVFDLETVFCLDTTEVVSSELFNKGIHGLQVLSSIRVLGLEMQSMDPFRPDIAPPPLDDEEQETREYLLKLLDYASIIRGVMALARQTDELVFQNIQTVAIVPRDLYTHQRVERHMSALPEFDATVGQQGEPRRPTSDLLSWNGSAVIAVKSNL
ncbi:hypothetical protein VM1G_09020 [Cytospora mali]|uniref:Uncharacterized protein n=1 Tax=Cytospora mali TaxID=578113 RepID=A0A194W9Z2_CYTMA|nr:hypothetical protein VM1G_09020 [Valsa mali]